MNHTEPRDVEKYRALVAYICTQPKPGLWRDSDLVETPLRLRRNLIIDDVMGFRPTVERSINEFQGPPGSSRCLMQGMLILRWCARNGSVKGLLTLALENGGKDGISHRAGDVCITIHPEYMRRGLATMLLDELLTCAPVNLERQSYSAHGAKFIAGYLSRKSIPFQLEYETPDEFCARTVQPGAELAYAHTCEWLKQYPGPHTNAELVTALYDRAVADGHLTAERAALSRAELPLRNTGPGASAAVHVAEITR